MIAFIGLKYCGIAFSSKCYTRYSRQVLVQNNRITCEYDLVENVASVKNSGGAFLAKAICKVLLAGI